MASPKRHPLLLTVQQTLAVVVALIREREHPAPEAPALSSLGTRFEDDT